MGWEDPGDGKWTPSNDLLEDSLDRGAWRTAVMGFQKSGHGLN